MIRRYFVDIWGRKGHLVVKSKFHRGRCIRCGQVRLLNNLNLCADCMTFDDFVNHILKEEESA